MTKIKAIALNRIATVHFECGGKNSLVAAEIVRRAKISIVAREIIERLAARLGHAGIVFRFNLKNSMTASVYLSVQVFDATGQKLSRLGATIRIADHPGKAGSSPKSNGSSAGSFAARTPTKRPYKPLPCRSRTGRGNRPSNAPQRPSLFSTRSGKGVRHDRLFQNQRSQQRPD